MNDLADQPFADLARGPEDPRGPALASLGDHLPCTRVQLRAHLLHPQVGRSDGAGVVLRAHLGENDEVPRQTLDQLELAVVLQGDRPIRDFEVAEAESLDPVDELLELALRDRQLGEAATEHRRDSVLAVARELGLEVGRRERGPPAELDDVDRVADHLDEPVDLGDREAPVQDVRDAHLAGLEAPLRELEKAAHFAEAYSVVRSAPTVTT